MTESTTDVGATYSHECDFCDARIEGSSLAEVQEHGRTHITDQHHSEFEQVFADQISGKPCFNGCGFTFPNELEDGEGFDCPNCSYDNFPEFADRHIWWRVELE